MSTIPTPRDLGINVGHLTTREEQLADTMRQRLDTQRGVILYDSLFQADITPPYRWEELTDLMRNAGWRYVAVSRSTGHFEAAPQS